VAALAFRLEDQAAQTFAAAAGQVTSSSALAAAASIAPVEAMHAAVLRLMLGEEPVPATFTAGAIVSPHDLTV
jgi:ferritin-like protein